MIRILYYIIVFIGGVVLQFGLSQYAAPHGIFPNILLTSLIFIGLLRGPLAGELLGFSWGLAWDALSVETFGSHALLFTLMGYLSGRLSRQWDESKIITQMVITGLASLAFWAGKLIIFALFGSAAESGSVTALAGFQVLANMIISPIIFILVAPFRRQTPVRNDNFARYW